MNEGQIPGANSAPSERRMDRALITQAWGLPIAVGMLLVALWTLIIVVSGTQRERLLEDSQRELAQLDSAVAQHAASLLRDIQTDLVIMDRWLQANPKIDPRTDPAFVSMVDAVRRTSGGMFDPRLVSTDGKLYYVPTADRKPLADVSDRPYFKAHAEAGPRQLYIGEPVKSRVTGKLGIPISWRLEAPVSGISVVFANIDLDKLLALHEDMRLKPDGSILLLRTDGVILSRAPSIPELIGRNISGTPGFREQMGVRQRGTFVSQTPAADGVIRLISYERLNDYPIVVLVNRSVAAVLEQYESRRRIVLGVAVLLTCMALALAWVTRRSQVALLKAREALLRLEATDSLTGVMSRRAFLERGGAEFSRARRYGRPLSVLALDIDHFKRVNDGHGHAAGDEVLAGCAAAWGRTLRGQDLLGRIGGEEFCAVLPETPAAAALVAAEKLRRAALGLSFAKAEGLTVTVSVGVAEIALQDRDLAAMMERADRALYLAKERGRNRVESLSEQAVAAEAAEAAEGKGSA